MRLHTLNGDLEPTGLTEVNTRKAFVNILENDVIKPLTRLKVGQEDLVLAGLF